MVFEEDKPLCDGQTDGCHPGVFFLDGVSFSTPQDYLSKSIGLMAVFALDKDIHTPRNEHLDGGFIKGYLSAFSGGG